MRDLPIETKAEFADEYQLLRWVLRWRRGLQRTRYKRVRPILPSKNPQIHAFALDKEIVDARLNLRCRAMLNDV